VGEEYLKCEDQQAGFARVRYLDSATLDIFSSVKPLPDSRASDIISREGWDVFSLLHRKDGRL
jgi:hypothetical protein